MLSTYRRTVPSCPPAALSASSATVRLHPTARAQHFSTRQQDSGQIQNLAKTTGGPYLSSKLSLALRAETDTATKWESSWTSSLDPRHHRRTSRRLSGFYQRPRGADRGPKRLSPAPDRPPTRAIGSTRTSRCSARGRPSADNHTVHYHLVDDVDGMHQNLAGSSRTSVQDHQRCPGS